MPNRIFNIRDRVFELFLFGGLFVSDRLMKSRFPSFSGRFVRNAEGPWGFGVSDAPFRIAIVTLLGVLLIWWVLEGNRMRRLSSVFMLAGGAGNLVDRIVFGYVRDLVLVGFFPAFNLADVFLTTGAVLFLFSFRGTEKRPS